MSESLATRWPWLTDFLGVEDWGPLRAAITEQDNADRARMVLLLVFASGLEYRAYIADAEEAAKGYDRIVVYLREHGYNHIEYFELQRIHIDVSYGDFHRQTDDVKRDLGLFEPDLLPPIDLHREAEKLGLSRDQALKALQEAARCVTRHGKAKPRLKWEKDAQSDENPAAFAWRAYQAEAKAGTLHRGMIGREDKLLARDLANWLRTHAMPEGIDIPTLPEWNTRQLKIAKETGVLRAAHQIQAVAHRRRATSAPAA